MKNATDNTLVASQGALNDFWVHNLLENFLPVLPDIPYRSHIALPAKIRVNLCMRALHAPQSLFTLPLSASGGCFSFLFFFSLALFSATIRDAIYDVDATFNSYLLHFLSQFS